MIRIPDPIQTALSTDVVDLDPCYRTWLVYGTAAVDFRSKKLAFFVVVVAEIDATAAVVFAVVVVVVVDDIVVAAVVDSAVVVAFLCSHGR